MIELFLLLFVLQGETTTEWVDSCNNDFVNYEIKFREINHDIYFCTVVNDLRLDEQDLEKLGRDINWYNYTVHTTNEFIDKWDFYQDNAIYDTLQVDTYVSGRESLPPPMSVQISFDYNDESEIKKFNESFGVNPLYENKLKQTSDNHNIFDHNDKKRDSIPTLSSLSSTMSPYDQLLLGFESTAVECKDGLELHLKLDGKPICITESTFEKLVERKYPFLEK